MTNGTGNGSVTGLPPRAEKLTIGILSVIAIVIFAVRTGIYIGDEWRLMRSATERQQTQITANAELIKQVNTTLNAMSTNIAAMRDQMRTTRRDPFRGDDMREWGDEAEELNEGFEAPELDNLPGYKRRNAYESKRASSPASPPRN